MIESLESIPGSRRVYGAAELVEIINKVRMGANVTRITRTHGIRNKVNQLLGATKKFNQKQPVGYGVESGESVDDDEESEVGDSPNVEVLKPADPTEIIKGLTDYMRSVVFMPASQKRPNIVEVKNRITTEIKALRILDEKNPMLDSLDKQLARITQYNMGVVLYACMNLLKKRA